VFRIQVVDERGRGALPAAWPGSRSSVPSPRACCKHIASAQSSHEQSWKCFTQDLHIFLPKATKKKSSDESSEFSWKLYHGSFFSLLLTDRSVSAAPLMLFEL
jgi:hypothetical protein